MLGALFNNPFDLIIWIISLIIAITVHEFAHALAAERLGDPTPRLMGRLTLNPLSHLDPLGTLMLIIARFGWGKPVPFDPFNLRNPRRDSALISLAGPAANFLLAIFASLILLILPRLPFGLFTYLIIGLLQQIVLMCIVLGVFNLVPIHPLDGFKIVEGLLPEKYAREWHELERYGVIFLVFLIFPIFGTSPIHTLIWPVINFLVKLLI